MKKILILIVISLCLPGCMPRFNLIPGAYDPLQEKLLSGNSQDKILVIPVTGFISDKSEKGFLSPKPGLLQELKSRLNKAEKDPDIRVVILKIDSPGGSGCISDIIYDEIKKFKERTGKKVVSLFMNLATSGAYYIAIPSDYIIAHPTTITGSIGAVTLNFKSHEFLDKLGIEVVVTKSGKNKDIGSPFRNSSLEEKEIVQNIINDLAKRFLNLVFQNRNITDENKKLISTARIFTANEALKINLIDGIGYFDDAVSKSMELGNLTENPRIIFYKRVIFPDDNVYNNISLSTGIENQVLLDKSVGEIMGLPETGFNYLWTY